MSNPRRPTITDICRSTDLVKAPFHPGISLSRFIVFTAQLWRTLSPTISHLSSTSVAVTSSYARLISHSMHCVLQVVLATNQIKEWFSRLPESNCLTGMIYYRSLPSVATHFQSLLLEWPRDRELWREWTNAIRHITPHYTQITMTQNIPICLLLRCDVGYKSKSIGNYANLDR